MLVLSSFSLSCHTDRLKIPEYGLSSKTAVENGFEHLRGRLGDNDFVPPPIRAKLF